MFTKFIFSLSVASICCLSSLTGAESSLSDLSNFEEKWLFMNHEEVDIDHNEINSYPNYLEYVFNEKGKWKIKSYDGSIWEALPLNNNQRIEDILCNWVNNDEIRLSRFYPPEAKALSDEKMLFSIYNLNQETSVLAILVLPPQVEHLTYRISKIDKNGYFITLNDGSDWTIGWLCSWGTSKWHKGDRIIISKRSKRYYGLINAELNDYALAEMTSWE